MTLKFKTLLASTALAATLSTSSAIAQEFRIDRLFVVGDSLSDAGTYSNAGRATTAQRIGGLQAASQPIPPALLAAQANGIGYRFTTNNSDGSSQVYSEVLADRLGVSFQPNLITGVPAVAGTALDALSNDIPVGGNGFAQGGARVALPALDNATRVPQGITQTPITTQVDRLLANDRQFNSNDLVILWGGSNDVLANAELVGDNLRTVPEAVQAIGVAANQMVAQVDRVLAAGATNVVVVTVPDIGTNTPLGTGSSPQGAGLLTLLTDGNATTPGFNDILTQGVAGRVTVVDSNAVLNDVLEDPARYGFAAIDQRRTTECSGSALTCVVGVDTISDGNQRVFADPVHPTNLTHRVLAEAAFGALVAIGQAGVIPVAIISGLRQQSIGLEQRLNLGAFFIDDGTGNRIRRPVGNVEVYGGAELGFYESDPQQVVPGFDAATQVLKAAADVMITPNIMVGAGISIDHGQIDFDEDRGGFDSRLYIGGVFGVAQIIPGVYVNSFVGGGLIDIYDIDRSFTAGSARESYDADTDGTYFIAKSSVGAVLPVGNGFFVNPSLGFAYERVDIDGYSETALGGSSGALAATVGDLEYVGYRGTAALSGFYRPPSDPSWTLGLRASWEHDFNDDDVRVPFSVAGAAQNVQVAPRPDDSYGFLTATVAKELTHSTSVNLQGTTNIGQDGVTGYTIGLVFKHTF